MSRIVNNDIARFWSKVTKAESGCWLWIGALSRNGYAPFFFGGKIGYAHRFSFLVNKGEIPDGMDIDHICLVRNCVNPDHIRCVTHQQNMRHGNSIPARNSRKTHCPQGHEYSPENTYTNNRGERQCKTCCSEREKRSREKRQRLMQPQLQLVTSPSFQLSAA